MLDAILRSARERAASAAGSLDRLLAAAAGAPPARGFAAALTAPGLSVIAEVKRRSPSAGAIDPDLDPAAQAAAYGRGGAAAISVLTEPHFFDGSLDDLLEVTRSVTLPVLRKDFTLHPAQVWEARAAGADAVLVILAAVDDALLIDLLETAAAAGLDTLVEVHDEAEVERALNAGARLVGVNNRDLATFTTDPAVAERIAPLLGDVPVTVAESGVGTPEMARRMAAAGYDAVLVGEALVRAADPALLVSLISGTEPEGLGGTEP